ncbi:MAG TPA: glycogen-binding domain-containing protein [Gemmatimonadales bacterium]|nr:glycogen-binding domain-containing protein [Gemmatimonadales bacterium]
MATGIPASTPSGPRVALGALALLLWSGGRADALQAQVSVDLAGLGVRYEGVSTMAGAQLAPTIRHAGSRLYAELGGSAARFDDGSWSADGGGLAAWRPAERWGMGPELIGFAGVSGAKESRSATDLGGTVRLHRDVGAFDLYGGASATWNDGVLGTRTITTAELGAILARGDRQLSVALAPAWGGGARYTDLSVYARREGRVALELTGGMRAITAPSSSSHGWIGATAELRLGDRLTLVATGGGFPPDPGLGFPGGRFASLGIRLGRSPRSLLRPPQATPVARPLPWPGATFEVRDAGNGERELVVTAASATSVEIAGDFTDWRPVALAKDGEKWRVRLSIPRGVHRFNLRLDGGAWRVPPGVAHATDEFGGEAGLLAID